MGTRNFSKGVEEAIAVTFPCGDELLSKFLARYSCIRIKKITLAQLRQFVNLVTSCLVRGGGLKEQLNRWGPRGEVKIVVILGRFAELPIK